MSHANTSEGERSEVALLLVDVINTFAFAGAAPLVRAAERAIPPLVALSRRARAARVPVIYVNDNFGQWRSDFNATVARCTADGARGKNVARALRPQADDYFVLKPQQSGFFSSVLSTLLGHLGVRHLILAGFATDKCLFFTASDAHMRGFQLTVASDCTAANSPAAKARALLHLRSALGVDVRRARAVRFGRRGQDARANRPR